MSKLTDKQWNHAIDLWNKGLRITAIAEELGVPRHYLTGGNSLVGVICQQARHLLAMYGPGEQPIFIPESAKRKITSESKAEERTEDQDGQ